MFVARRLRRIGRGSALVLVALLVGLIAVPPSAQASHGGAHGTQGLQDGWAVGDGGEVHGGQLLSDQFASIRVAGAGWVRINFRLGQCFTDWASTCTHTGKTALQTYDEVVNAALNTYNLKVLGALNGESLRGGQAAWTANNAEVLRGDGSNQYVKDFAASAGRLAAHFKGRVDQWEIWNEPNAWEQNPSPGVYSGGSFIYPSNFAWMLKLSHDQIKANNPSATVIAGGLFGHDIGAKVRGRQGGYKRSSGDATACPSAVPSGGDYLCATYDMGRTKVIGWPASGAPVDHVGQHLYINQGTPTSSSQVTKYLDDLRKVYVTYGREPTTKQTHVTEVGWTTAAVSANVQAKNLQTAYETFRATAYVGRAYWFRTQDLPVAGDYHGLVRSDRTSKPSFSAYQKYATYSR